MLGYLVVLQSVALLSFASASASSLRGSKDFSAVSWAPHVQQVSRSAASISASAHLLWAPLDTMPHNMSAFATVETESGLVVSLGGYDSSADTPQRPDTYILDPTSLSQGAGRAQWKSSDSLLIGRTDMGSSLAPQLGEGIAMVIGGFTGSNVVDGVNYNTYTASCETLDTTTGKVVDLGVPDFPFENTGVAAAYLPNGQVVAVGGFGYHEDMSFFYSSATYVLTADSDSGALKWKEGPDYPWERSGLVCSSISTGILCAGGGETDPAYHNAAIFDGTKWTIVQPMLEARIWAGVTTAYIPDSSSTDGQLKEVVYVSGGFCKSSTCFFSPLASVEYYDVAAGMWVEATPLPIAQASGGTASHSTPLGAVVMAMTGDPYGDVYATLNP